MPAEPVDDRAADHRAERHGEAADRPPHADRLATLGDREGLADQRQSQREDHRGPRPLEDARGDQRADARRQCRGGRGGREYGDAEREDAAAAEAVAEGSPGHEQAGEREDEAVDRPLEPRQPGVEVDSQHRKRSGHDQVVECGHEQPEGGEDEGPGLVRLTRLSGLGFHAR
jgi:hypothetical protein